MMARDFLIDLTDTCDLFSWEVQPRNSRIRGSLKTGETRVPFDPITALAFLKSGRAFAQGDWLRAGRMLGLSGADSDSIIDAANNKLWKYVDDDLALDGYAEWLRAQIISAVGLEPEFASEPILIDDTLAETARPTAGQLEAEPVHI